MVSRKCLVWKVNSKIKSNNICPLSCHENRSEVYVKRLAVPYLSKGDLHHKTFSFWDDFKFVIICLIISTVLGVFVVVVVIVGFLFVWFVFSCRGREAIFCSTRVWTAMQALYHLSHTTSPFCSGYFGDRVSLFAQAHPGLQSHFMLPLSPGCQAYTTTPRFFLLLRWGSAKFSPREWLGTMVLPWSQLPK
jgi:hypothetical protein